MLMSIAKFIGVNEDQLHALHKVFKEDRRVRSSRIKTGRDCQLPMRDQPQDHDLHGKQVHPQGNEGFPWAKLVSSKLDPAHGTYTVEVVFYLEVDLTESTVFHEDVDGAPRPQCSGRLHRHVKCSQDVVLAVHQALGVLPLDEEVEGKWE